MSDDQNPDQTQPSTPSVRDKLSARGLQDCETAIRALLPVFAVLRHMGLNAPALCFAYMDVLVRAGHSLFILAYESYGTAGLDEAQSMMGELLALAASEMAEKKATVLATCKAPDERGEGEGEPLSDDAATAAATKAFEAMLKGKVH